MHSIKLKTTKVNHLLFEHIERSYVKGKWGHDGSLELGKTHMGGT